jgi:hypothetical protein
MCELKYIGSFIMVYTTLCDKVCQWGAAGPGTLDSPTNKTDRHDITEILLKTP